MRAIVNVNQSWGIGRNGELLAYIPEDMRFFRSMTKGGTVIMGRKTLDSFPGGKPLKGRLNIVLTREPERLTQKAVRDWQEKTSESSLPEAKSAEDPEQTGRFPVPVPIDGNGTRLLALRDLSALLDLREELLKAAFVIGGAQIYRELLPYCDECLVTINDSTREADTFFPDLDAAPEWYRSGETEEKEQDGVHYRFTVYRRKNADAR